MPGLAGNAESSGGKLASPAPFSCLRLGPAKKFRKFFRKLDDHSNSRARVGLFTSTHVKSSDSLLGLVCSLGSGRAWGGLGGGRGGRRACVHFKKEDFPFSLGKFPGNLRGFSSNKGPEISYQSAGISELGQVHIMCAHHVSCAHTGVEPLLW